MHYFIRCRIILLIAFVLFLSPSFCQYYDWATALSIETWGHSSAFISTDYQGNGILRGTRRSCSICAQNYVSVINTNGQEIWSTDVFGSAGTIATIGGVSSDYQQNRYILFQNPSGNLQNIGAFSTSSLSFIIKYTISGTPIRLTNLTEVFTKIVVDSTGNMFTASAGRIRRYNVFGNMVWEKTGYNINSIDIDTDKNCFIATDTSLTKLNPSGNISYHLPIGGNVIALPDGKTILSNGSGVFKYNKFGMLMWNQPQITGAVQLNSNGNIYEFTGSSIRKYNVNGTNIQWTHEKLANGIVSKFGEIYIGSTYNVTSDVIRPCPFQILILANSNTHNTQSWIAQIKDSSSPPFQAAIYTNGMETSVCTGQPVKDFTYSGPLFTTCTNAFSNFDSNNTFSTEISGSVNFNNPINIGDPNSAVIPDTIASGGNYKIRVSSSTAGATVYPNIPANSFSTFGVIQNPASLSVSGNQSICSGQTFNLNITTAQNASIWWYNGSTYLGDIINNLAINPDSSGSYHAQVFNNGCIRQSDTLFLIENPRPFPDISPSGILSICQGDSIQLTVNDIDLTSIKWRYNNVNIPGQNDTTIYASVAGLYSARVFNSYGCARTSDQVEIVIPCKHAAIDIDRNFTVSPNPCTGNLTISGLLHEAVLIQIFDLSGRCVLRNNYNDLESTDLNVDLEILDSGNYLLNMIQKNKSETKLITVF